eukprot:GHVT01024469.1.p1 GENE.GHVT01024469.1~~GHVT01024469.1.p1  ORF type:complete len:134 (+),score=13.40 GHVT01024469.1:160-561(+)
MTLINPNEDSYVELKQCNFDESTVSEPNKKLSDINPPGSQLDGQVMETIWRKPNPDEVFFLIDGGIVEFNAKTCDLIIHNVGVDKSEASIERDEFVRTAQAPDDIMRRAENLEHYKKTELEQAMRRIIKRTKH